MIEAMNITNIETAMYDDVFGMTQAIYAAQESDHRTQVGAYISGIQGSNSTCKTSGGRPHAETTALLNCARMGISTRGETLYAPWAACPDCAQSIITAGVSRVVVNQGAMDATPEDWRPQVENGLNMLIDAGVTVEVMQPIGMYINIRGQKVEV